MNRTTRASNGGWILLAVSMLLAGGCSTRNLRLDDVIEPGDLARRLNDADKPLMLLDVRDAAAYDAEHVATSQRLDIKQWHDESLAAETGLSHEALWHRRIGEAGVSGREPIVVYDDGRMTEAARVWFVMQHFGVDDVAVLNGGYPALKPMIDAERIGVSTTAPAATNVTYRPSTNANGSIGLVERARLREMVDRHEAQVLDVRTAGEYAGTDLRKNPRGGHIPNAINIPHSTLLNEDGRLKSPNELATILDAAGLQRGQPVITHCQSGGRASLAALAVHRAGYGPVFNYYLSFGDWSKDATCPIESGDAR